jgi:lactate permease
VPIGAAGGTTGPQTDAAGRRRVMGGATGNPDAPHAERPQSRQLWLALLPFLILIAVVVLWTGPWSTLPKVTAYKASVVATSSLTGKPVISAFAWTPFIAGSAIFVSWLLILLVARPNPAMIGAIFAKTFRQMWGALLVGFFIFGLAYVFIYSGMSNTMAFGFSKLGLVFIVLAPILGWIGVALSGSNTSTNTLFGAFQLAVGKLLGVPLLLLPSLNSVGAEVGKPVAPQTTSVGVSTTSYVRNEGAAIRHNMGWTLVLLAYLIVIGLGYYLFAPHLMSFAAK